MSGPLILVLVIAVVVVGLVAIYNGLVKSKERCEEAWSHIDTLLKARYDKIPNLVETVKGYAKHEKETLEQVIKARSQAVENVGPPGQQGGTENMLSSALKSIFALSERYPDLKADKRFADLQEELVDIENKIQAARQFYNGQVRDYNITVKKFPNVIFAGMLGYKEMEFFELENKVERENVKVAF